MLCVYNLGENPQEPWEVGTAITPFVQGRNWSHNDQEVAPGLKPWLPNWEPTLQAVAQDYLPGFIRCVASTLRKFSGQRQDNKPLSCGVMKAWHRRDVQGTLAG